MFLAWVNSISILFVCIYVHTSRIHSVSSNKEHVSGLIFLFIFVTLLFLLFIFMKSMFANAFSLLFGTLQFASLIPCFCTFVDPSFPSYNDDFLSVQSGQ
jgi:hypothetical protein